jgi:hypothetical protein
MATKSADIGTRSDFDLSFVFLISNGGSGMGAEATDAREMRDHELNEALETHAEDELDGLSIQNQRLARIQEYEEAAVSRSDPFAAVIGMGNAHFQRVFEHLGAAILEELDSHPHSVEELREFGPEIRLLVKLRSAIETDLEVQPPEAETPAAAFSGRIQGTGLDTRLVSGKRDLLPKRWVVKD